MFIVELLVIFQNVLVDIGKQVYMWILNLGVHVGIGKHDISYMYT